MRSEKREETRFLVRVELQLQQRQRELEQPQQLQQQTGLCGAFAKMMASLFTFENLYRACLDCRRKKRGKKAALAFEVNAEENLLALTRELSERSYRPSPSFCFVARNDKHREVFAADFRDRVVHHLLVRYLEQIWEPVFIHDSYACRRGKGTHGAVERLQSFTRKVTANRTRRAWFAQLDIKAFFPSMDRQILLDLVLSRLDNEEMRWLAEIVIMHDPTVAPVFTCSPGKWRNVPPQKSLFSVPGGKGLPIGNLTSQFFANVYLNSLDQFVKHTLKAGYYIRYVDDFILLHECREKLEEWRLQIGEFLKVSLKLDLHPHRQIIRPISNGINFLGYIVRPSHLLVRRRIYEKCKDSIDRQTTDRLNRNSRGITVIFPHYYYDQLHSTINSYLGAFRHASCHRLIQSIFHKFEVMRLLFIRRNFRAIKKWSPPFHPVNLYTQYRFFRIRFRGVIVFQVGCYLEFYDKDAVWASRKLGWKRIPFRRGFYARCGVHIARSEILYSKLAGRNLLVVLQTGRIGRHIAGRIAGRIEVNGE
ncbi:MAG: reverse transcriptase/maturase family protein [Thermodesulfobacteriota bacterium]